MSKDERARRGSEPGRQSALLITDVQNDFCASGALPVPDCERILPALNRHLSDAQARGLPIYASRDWHPEKTVHFKAHGGEWPPHCVQDSAGAEFHPALKLPPDTVVISKGDDPAEHGYSSFEGHTPEGKAFLDELHARGIDHLYVSGIATDYCVRATVLDALESGVRVTLLTDAIAGIDAKPGDVDRAMDEMRKHGADVADAVAP